jgi:hypothetical protein
MRNHTSRLDGRASAVIAALSILCLSCPSSAQITPTRRDERRADMEARQTALRNVERAAKGPASKKSDSRPSYRQVAEDFEKLQVQSHELCTAVESSPHSEYKQIGEAAAEIRRRAARLKEALALPGAEEERPPRKAEEALTPEGLKSAVLSLDASVKSFVWNPVFQKPDVVDLEQSAKARRDLEEILRQSEDIRKAARSLAKSRGERF